MLWGEIRRFISLAKIPLPLQYNHLKIRQVLPDGTFVPDAELVGQVSNSPEGLLGRHSTAGFKAVQDDIPRTLCLIDEASGVLDDAWTSIQTWADAILVIGNPFPCANFFYKGVKAGDLLRDPNDPSKGYFRKIIKITAEDSPNIRLARKQEMMGLTPTNEIIIPGVKSWKEYQQNLKLWDRVLVSVGLQAEFYEGAEELLFPPEWLNRAALVASKRSNRGQATAVGVDPAEGGDRTTMCAINAKGIVELVSKKTPDTSVITAELLAFIRKHGVSADRVAIDRGGGGKQHADRLRSMGYQVRTVAFGEAIQKPLKRGIKKYMPYKDRLEIMEDRYVYVNRRAEMFGELSLILDPSLNPFGFAIPAEYEELRKELAPIPRTYDDEGRLKLLPKHKGEDAQNAILGKSSRESLVGLVGHSPDNADSLALALHALLHNAPKSTAGVA